MPSLSMYKDSPDKGHVFFEQMRQLLAAFGISSTVADGQRRGMFQKTLYISPGTENIIRFFDLVGYRYSLGKEREAFLWSNYLKAYQYEGTVRRNEAQRLRDTGLSYDKIGKRLGISTQSAHNLLHKSTTRSSWKFPTYKEWIEPRFVDGTLYLKIVDRESGGEADVYNITVDSPDHSYLLADGIDNFNCAEFLEDSAVFRRIHEAATATPQESAQEGHRYVMGVDWGRSEDFTAVAVIDINTKELVYLDRFNQTEFSIQYGRLETIYDRFHPIETVAEQNAMGMPIIEKLRFRLSIRPFVTSVASKNEAIDALALAFEQEQIKILNDPVLIAELQAYTADRLPSGRWKFGAPAGYHDDCLPPGALIKTSAGYRPIETIQVGDLVLTHTGDWQPVEAILEKPFDGDMHRFQFRSQVPLELTYNHPLYAAARDYTGDKSGEFTRRLWPFPAEWRTTYRAVTVIPKWQESQIVINESYDNSPRATNLGLRSVPVDEPLARLLGRFLADGHRRRHGNYVLELAFGDTEQQEAERHTAYLTDWGVTVRQEPFNEGKRGFELVFASKLLWHLFDECYDEQGEKILPAWAFQLGDLLRHTADEWLLGDGWRNTKRGHAIGCTTSRRLALEMRDLFLMSNRYATIDQRTNLYRLGRKCKDQWWVTVYDEWPDTGRTRRISDFETATRLKSHEVYHHCGTVYNLQVANDHSFVAEGIVVHNCVMALALAWDGAKVGSREIVEQRRTGLGRTDTRSDYRRTWLPHRRR